MFKIEKKGAFGNSSIKEVMSLVDDIDFEPPYQRYGNVWSDEKRQLLIDSILNGYDLPKFYLHYITDYRNEINNSGKSYAIIDGKQRLQTLHDFLLNQLRLSKNFIYEKDPSISLSGKTYGEIAQEFPDIKYDFDLFDLDVVYVITDEIERIEELFYRLNEGMPLNSAEKRNRHVGYINDEIKNIITNHPFFTEKFIYTNKRLQYADTCLKLIIIEYNNSLVSFTKTILDNFIKDNKNITKKLSETINKVRDNLDKLSQIFNDDDHLLKSRSNIPVYYYFISRFDTSIEHTRPFLEKFYEIRVENRKQKESNPILNEFDRQNQQGTHRDKSMIFRESVLQKFYIKFIDDGIHWNTRVPLDDLGIILDIE
jgi:hypothetical protein